MPLIRFRQQFAAVLQLTAANRKDTAKTAKEPHWLQIVKT